MIEARRIFIQQSRIFGKINDLVWFGNSIRLLLLILSFWSSLVLFLPFQYSQFAIVGVTPAFLLALERESLPDEFTDWYYSLPNSLTIIHHSNTLR